MVISLHVFMNEKNENLKSGCMCECEYTFTHRKYFYENETAGNVSHWNETFNAFTSI